MYLWMENQRTQVISVKIRLACVVFMSLYLPTKSEFFNFRDEFIGVEGRVKITNPDEYEQEVNANDIQPEGIGEKIQNTAKRSLPDLPVDSQVNGRPNVNWESVGDAASELYATVVLQDEKSKKHNRQKSDSDSISPSLTYTKVKKDHPYDKLKKVEHPYAQVISVLTV